MSQGESQLSHILHAAERWANQTDEHSVEEHTGQITYLRELVESAMSEQGNSLPMHLLRSGIMRPLATLQRQLAYMVAQSMYQDPEQAALCAQAAPRTQPSPPGPGRLCWPGPAPVARSPPGPELSGPACRSSRRRVHARHDPALPSQPARLGVSTHSRSHAEPLRVRAPGVLPPRRAHDQRDDARAHRRRAPARRWPRAPARVALLPRVSDRGAARLGQAVYAGTALEPRAGGARTGLPPLSHARALPRTDGLQTGMVSLLAKAAALHAPCGQALQALPMDSP